VVGIAIGTALLPLLARQLRAGQNESAMANQNRAIEFGLLFSLPSAVALWILAEPMIRVLFQHGHFSPADTLRAAGALAAFAAGLPAFVLVKALTPGFFAREDTRTPLYIAVVAITVNMALNAAFLYGTSLALVGIALATSISGWLNVVMLGGVLWRRGQLTPDSRLVSRGLRMAAATLGMAAALVIGLVALHQALARPNLLGVLALLGVCAIGGVVYGALGVILGVLNLSELRFMMRRQSKVAASEDAPSEP
jgi:putative peptidoglycan lipid II flippase